MKTKPRRYSIAIERRLLAAYNRANSYDISQGLTWYQTAHDTGVSMAQRYNLSVSQCLGVIAALSPGNEWSRNIQDAETLISYWHAGTRGRKLPVVGTYGRRNRNKAIAILEGDNPLDVLGGPKVRAFYANMLNPSDPVPVTIDRHAKCCAYGLVSPENAIVKPSEYEYIARHFRKAARRVGLVPSTFQAVVWVTWRRLHGVLEQNDLPF